nr:hypothetical protein [Pedobacter panaciterrae]
MTNKEEIYNFLKLNDFKLVKQNTSKYFGDYYDTFADDDFKLRFSSSKSFENVDICNNEDKDWYDLALVKALLYNEIKLNEITDTETYNIFLMKELNHIRELFSKRNYPITKMKLSELGNERAKQIFQRNLPDA